METMKRTCDSNRHFMENCHISVGLICDNIQGIIYLGSHRSVLRKITTSAMQVSLLAQKDEMRCTLYIWRASITLRAPLKFRKSAGMVLHAYKII